MAQVILWKSDIVSLADRQGKRPDVDSRLAAAVLREMLMDSILPDPCEIDVPE
jgi:hypothetical protein